MPRPNSFRDQALIAMENARLFNETQEALEHQKASGEVLRAIAQSVADTTPVFENILDASQRLFGTEEVCIFMVGEDGMVRPAAARGPGFSAARNDVMPLEGSRTGRVIRERRIHHIPDGLAEPDTPPALLERMRSSGNVSIAFAPMLWEDSGLGSIAILRSPPRPFSERELELLRGFADQAVIAIQNARMFRETNEALEQQKASADVLSAISKSVADTAPVFEEILGACQRLFGSDEIGVYTIGDDDMVRVAAWRGPRAEEVRHDVTPVDESITGRIIRERRTHHIPDLRAEPNLSPTVRERVDRLGGASLLYAPMLWEDRGLGSILVARSPPKPFSDQEQALLQSFADQAAIAIQNARLFQETQAKTSRPRRVACAADGDGGSAQGHQPLGVRPEIRPQQPFSRRLRNSAGPPSRRFTSGMETCAGLLPSSACRRHSSARRGRVPYRSVILCTPGEPRARAKSRISPTPGPTPTISTRRPLNWPAIARSS